MRIGKITENALKRSVLKQIRTEYKGMESAAVGSDCAFSKDGNCCSTVSTVTANVQDAGFFVVMKAAGSLIAQGITPDHVELSIMLPPDTEEQYIKRVVADAILACRKCATVYAGGHTEVTTAVTRPLITAIAVGTGEAGSPLCRKKAMAGDALVVTKWTALEGTAMIAAEKKAELATKYPVPFIEDAENFKLFMDMRKEAEILTKCGVSAVHDLSSGGVFAGLWEMAERAGCGLKADLKAIPIKQETIEICEFFEINPYQLLSGGALLIATGNPEMIVSALEEEGIHSGIIGNLTDGNDRILVNDDEQRFLERPQADEIHKILQ